MTFSERMVEMLDQGIAATKDFALKAGAKAQDLGERGVLMVDIKQLEMKAQKLLVRLGNETYAAFAERNQESIGRDAPEIASIMAELAKLRSEIDQKETELRNR
ncbi:MAG: hypothetical protein LBU85_06885 [Treponema sp.]|jgi:hypothetical protein|nr:hypothetical protein [Treponema sp.]